MNFPVSGVYCRIRKQVQVVGCMILSLKPCKCWYYGSYGGINSDHTDYFLSSKSLVMEVTSKALPVGCSSHYSEKRNYSSAMPACHYTSLQWSYVHIKQETSVSNFVTRYKSHGSRQWLDITASLNCQISSIHFYYPAEYILLMQGKWEGQGTSALSL